MKIFTLGLANTSVPITLSALLRPPSRDSVRGLVESVCLSQMALGAPIISLQRMQLRRLVMFAAWESEAAIDDFLGSTELG